jgi:hypothetical protein
MRGAALGILLVLSAAACGRDEALGPDAPTIPPVIDAPPGTPDSPFLVDAAPRLCSSAMGTADVTASGPGSNVTYQRLYAGGIWEVGPVAPAGPAPMTIELLYTNVDPFDADHWYDCLAGQTVACDTIGLVTRIQSVAAGAEVGDHTVTFTKSDNPAFTLDGTLTIDMFVHPFLNAPGRIAGSINASMGGRSVTGTFDSEFCAFLLTQTI